MSTNGNGSMAELDAALKRLEQFEQAEEQAHIDRMVDLRVKIAVAERMAAMQPALKRSEMSAAAKSEFIRSRIAAGRTGQEAQREYMALPWK